jgi:hypothetical protein
VLFGLRLGMVGPAGRGPERSVIFPQRYRRFKKVLPLLASLGSNPSCNTSTGLPGMRQWESLGSSEECRGAAETLRPTMQWFSTVLYLCS